MSTLVAEPLSAPTPNAGVHWLWEPYLARGQLAVLDGDPGQGKSLIAIDLAARISRGGEMPLGAPSPLGLPRASIILSAEEGRRTLRPRAEAAGADLDRVLTVAAYGGEPLALPEDIPALESFVLSNDAALVVIEPFAAFLRGAAANLDQSVRRVLTPLARMADYTGCAVLLVRHLCKAGGSRAMLRGQGSAGIVGAARAALLAAPHPADPSLRVLAVAKSNVSCGAPSLAYRVVSDGAGRPVVEWVGAVNVAADELAAPAAPVRPADRAAEWLVGQLAGGPRRASELFDAAKAEGVCRRTLYRAKADLGIDSHRAAVAGAPGWYWYDPDAPWPADAPFGKPPGEPPEVGPPGD
jgi:hypothetical protein